LTDLFLKTLMQKKKIASKNTSPFRVILLKKPALIKEQA